MSEFVFPLIMLVITLIVIIVILSVKLYLRNELFKRVQWVCSKNDNARDYYPLIYWIMKIQGYSTKRYPADRIFPHADRLNPIDIKYNLDYDEERELAEQIISEYKKKIGEEFLSGNLLPARNLCKLSDAEYFVYTFHNFLVANSCDHQSKEDVCVYSHSDKLFKYYKLTDYGVVYYKLLILASEYCSALGEMTLNIEVLMEELDAKSLRFYKEQQ
jgi:hypothetical protein